MANSEFTTITELYSVADSYRCCRLLSLNGSHQNKLKPPRSKMADSHRIIFQNRNTYLSW